MRSSTVSTEGLENVLRSWIEEYQLAISPSKYLRFYVLKSNFRPKSNYNTENNRDERYLEYLIPPYVTFSKLYFRGKEEIVNRLEFFMSRKQWYKHKRITHNIGFLLHGHPSSGCEKTSTIKGNQDSNFDQFSHQRKTRLKLQNNPYNFDFQQLQTSLSATFCQSH